MTGNELKAIREGLGLSATAFGLALGYTGKPDNIRLTIHRAELGKRAISPELERRALKIGRRGGANHSRRKAPS